MQIKNIKISNILNYDYVANLNKVSGISFRTKQEGVTNIVIGPNAAGKSNLLEIINQIFKVGLQCDYYYDKELNHEIQARMQQEKEMNGQYNEKKRKEVCKDVIKEYPALTNNIEKHKDHKNKRSKVVIKILFHKGDFDNMRFLLKNKDTINKLIKKYSRSNVQFTNVDKPKLLEEKALTLYFSFDEAQKRFYLKTRNFTSTQQFIVDYIAHKELIQICMHLYNKYEKNNTQPGWYSLKNTFAILGANRSYGNIKNRTYLPNMSSFELNKIIADQDTKNRGLRPLGYYLCKRKIKELNHYDTAFEKQFLDSINILLQKHFKLQLIVHTNIHDRNIRFMFLSNHGHIYHIDELSSGLQSIIFMVLAFFGHDLHHGLCIIDEPELHLHPQLQKTLVTMLDEIQKKLHIQFIIATHSPLFIDEKNIYNVVRVARDKASIMIKSVGGRISEHEANLIHMLKYEHMTKIFFVPKIIMVEGETDAYFFDYYLNYLQKEKDVDLGEFEVLPIGGKGRFKKRRHFLTKFGIDSYYIGDWDNILETFPIPRFKHYKRLIYSNKPEYEQYHAQYKTEFYGKLTEIIQNMEPETHDKVQGIINKYYQDGIYLFRMGDLETYTGLHKKGLEEIVYFTNNNFARWLQDPNFQEHKQEIDTIIQDIFVCEYNKHEHKQKKHSYASIHET